MNMSHEFQSTLYRTSRDMCDAIAFEWMMAGGLNNPDDIDAIAPLGAQHQAEECIEGWGLLRQIEGTERRDGEGDLTWLEVRDSSAAEVLDAFERFFAGRPDRKTIEQA